MHDSNKGTIMLAKLDRLPVDTEGRDDEYRSVGFVFDDPDPHDPLFRPATLPKGWTRHGTDHAMWSEIRDELGRKRVRVFYRDAAHNRQAFMRLETPHSYLLDRLYYGLTPIVDDSWLTLDEARRVLADMAEQCEQSAKFAVEHSRSTENPYWAERARERRAEAAKARMLIESLAVPS